MTTKYILVRVQEAEAEFPPNVVVERGKVVMPTTPIGYVRKAIHNVAKTHFLGVADMVTHTRFMTKEESAAVARIFETAMARGKRRMQ